MPLEPSAVARFAPAASIPCIPWHLLLIKAPAAAALVSNMRSPTAKPLIDADSENVAACRSSAGSGRVVSLRAFGRRGRCAYARTFSWAMRLLAAMILAAHAATAVAASDLLPIAKDFFAGADRLGDIGGKPPAAPVYRADELLGYLLLTDQVVPIPAYSGKPISTAVGIGLDGTITGTRIVHHEEPILVVGVTAEDLARYTAQYVGKSVKDRVKIGGEPRTGYKTVDGISGATITVTSGGSCKSASMMTTAFPRL